MTIDRTNPGELPESAKSTQLAEKIQTDRFPATSGLRIRQLGSGTIQITGGTSSPGTNTVKAQVNSVDISAEVDWTTSHANTALLLAQAINTHAQANPTTNNYYATVSGDTVTVRQRSSGAITGALAAVVGGDVTTTDVDFSGDTDTWTTVHSGDTVDGNEYYELGWSNVLAIDNSAMNNAGADGGARLRALELWTVTGGTTFAYWCGGIFGETSGSTAAVPNGTAIDVAAQHELIPWLDATYTLLIKLAADGVLNYNGKMI